MGLWDAFDPAAVTSNSGRTKAAICTANGTLSWFEVEAWIAVLNSQNCLGHADWRQPITPQPDASCDSQVPAAGIFPAQGFGTNCTGSELGNLYCTSLSNTGAGFPNTAPFANAQSFAYWSGSEYALLQLTRSTAVPLMASRAAAIRMSSICLYGLCVVDNPSLRLRQQYPLYRYGV